LIQYVVMGDISGPLMKEWQLIWLMLNPILAAVITLLILKLRRFW
jgi:hypothetical protein